MIREIGVAPASGGRDRPGSYGVVLDGDWRVAVVRVGVHAYLPGGGVEAGETSEQALHREIAEEAGLTVEIAACMGTLREWKAADPLLARLGTFFSCRLLGTCPSTEADHVLEWWRPTRAIRELTLEGDRFMVRRAVAPC